MRLAKELRITGVVQGVGFRWTAKHIADRMRVAGWARNNPDGSVSITVEGTEDSLDAFMKRLRERMGGYIEGMEVREVAAGKNRNGFDVVY